MRQPRQKRPWLEHRSQVAHVLSSPMNSRHRTILLVLVGAGLFATGYYVGGRRLNFFPSADLQLASGGSTAFTPPRGSADPKGSELSRLTEGLSDYRKQQRLYVYAERLTAAEMAGALNDALHLPLSQRNAALAVLLGRWSEFDPEAATRYASELPKSAESQELRERALRVWAGRDFSAALAWSLKQEKGDNRNRCLSELACHIATTDPAGAMRFVQSHFKPAEVAFAYQRLFVAWAERDFESAYAEVQALEPRLRSPLLLAVLQTRVEKEPRRVLEAASALKNLEHTGSLIDSALQTWVKRDLATAQQWALTQPPGRLRGAAIYECSASAARYDPESSLNWALNNLEGKEQDYALGSALWVIAERDRDAAISKARSFANDRTRESALGTVASAIAGTDPQTALQILGELPEGEARTTSTRSVCASWALNEPKAAAQWLMDHTSETEQPYTLRQIVQDWERNDPAAALAWAAALPASARKSEAVSLLLYNVVRNDSEAARSEFEKLDPETQREAGERIAQGWAYNDSKGAIQWATGLPDAEARIKAIKGAISVWAFQETTAAASWIDSLPAGPERDGAMQTFAIVTADKDPQEAVSWALSIGDSSVRHDALRKVLNWWVSHDKAAALSWLQTDTSIPGALKTELQGGGGGR